MTALLLALAMGTGVHLVIAGATPPRGTDRLTTRPRRGVAAWLRQAGLEGVDPRGFAISVAVLSAMTFLLAYALFGGLPAATTAAAFGATMPIESYRRRRHTRALRAQEAWPRLIEEIRVQTASAGRSIPQALLDVGRRGPEEVRPAFAAAHREWLLTTDLSRTVGVLKHRLADPTADMACETLLVAHELGGTDLDRRLEALAEDRRRDVHGRKEARSRQAGARFARWFVLLVPVGMALAGASIGNGRDAYRSSSGQIVVVIAIVLVIACWSWAGRVMRLPEPERVFGE